MPDGAGFSSDRSAGGFSEPPVRDWFSFISVRLNFVLGRGEGVGGGWVSTS